MSDDKALIRAKLVSDKPDVLMQCLEQAARHMRIVGTGMVDVPFRDQKKRKYAVRDRILLYLIGKLYASKLGLTDRTKVCCVELQEQLSIKKSSTLRKRLSELRGDGLIREYRPGKTVYHEIERGQVRKTVERIDAKYAGRPKDP